MQHVRVGHHDMPAIADGLPRVRGCIAIEGEDLDIPVEFGGQAMQLQHLILRERFGGEQIERPCLGIIANPLQDWEVVAIGFPARGGGDHNDILPFEADPNRLGLVGIELIDCSLFQGFDNLRAHDLRTIAKIRGFSRQGFPMGDLIRPFPPGRKCFKTFSSEDMD